MCLIYCNDYFVSNIIKQLLEIQTDVIDIKFLLLNHKTTSNYKHYFYIKFMFFQNNVTLITEKSKPCIEMTELKLKTLR